MSHYSLGRRRLLLSAAAAAGLATRTASAQQRTIVVGGKNFTEQLIIAEMTALLLRANGMQVDKRTGMGSTILRTAQENGQVHLYWEYTGTSLITYNRVTERMSAEQTIARVRELDGARGLVWLNPSRANNTYCLVMNSDDSARRSIRTLSELAAAVRGGANLTFASNVEFAERPDGLRPLQQHYSFDFGRANVRRMDAGLTYQALRDRQVDVALAFATDGRIPAFNFVVLRDDRDFFPAYALTPVVRRDVLEAVPQLAALLNGLSAKLDDETMARLNASVDVERRSIEDVAVAFLREQRLIP